MRQWPTDPATAISRRYAADAVARRLAQQLAGLTSPRTLRFPIDYLPLPDVLLTAQDSRFTGCIALRVAGYMPAADFSRAFRRTSLATGTDLLFLRQGQLVGLERMGSPGVVGISEVLKTLGYWRALMSPIEAASRDGVEYCQRLVDSRALSRAQLDEVVAEHARCRLFERAADRELMVDVRVGAEALVNNSPVVLDLRPSIAFGLVVHARPSDRRYQISRFGGQFVALKEHYDRNTNPYRLPPQVINALEALEDEACELGNPPRFRRLSIHDTAGVLVFLDRLDLLRRPN
ncbi:MAG: hypothetical protein KTR25_15920 [Myxococcales bacterium]|nr:hypothetical protein [Myxococcales bacterium]